MFAPFNSSRMLIANAREHLQKIKDIQTLFAKSALGSIYLERDESTGFDDCKVKVSNLDDKLPLHVFDIANNLRSALDHAVFDSARIIGGKPNPTGTKFPIGKTREDAERDIARYKDAETPDSLKALLLSLEPFKGGKNGLWELNDLRNEKSHRFLAPCALGSSSLGVAVPPSGRMHIVQDCSRWDPEQSSLTFAIVDPRETNVDVTKLLKPKLGISFGDSGPLRYCDVVLVFEDLIKNVDSAVSAIESTTNELSTQK